MTSPTPDNADALLQEAGFVRKLARALLRDDALADDVSQDVMTAALQQPTAPRNWRHWLAAVTRRLAGKAHRARRTRALHEHNAASDDDREQRTQQRLQLHQQLTAAVLALPEPYRTVVTLRFFDELPPRAIAKRTGTNSDTVRQQLRRGLQRLRHKLDADFGSRRAWIATFVSFGMGEASLPIVSLSVLAMNKLLIAACVLAAGTVFALAIDWNAEPEVAPVVQHDATAVPPRQANAAAAADEPQRELVAEPAKAICAVRVLDAAQRSVPNATVYCYGDDGTFVERRTDDQGRAAFDAAGRGGLLVECVGHVPFVRTMSERIGEHIVTMQRGHRIAGVLLVDGQPADAGTLLPLYGEGSFPGDVPVALREHLEWRKPSPIETGRNGTFEVFGLPSNWSGQLSLASHLWLLPKSGGTPTQHEHVELTEPRTDLELHTTRLPNVTGRVVWDDDDSPVAGAFLTVFAKFADGAQTPMTAAESRADGTFLVGLSPSSRMHYTKWCDPAARPQLASLRIESQARDSTGAREVRLDATTFAQGPVTLRMQRAVLTHFQVFDREGQPIADARVQANTVSDPTDDAGRGTFGGEPADVKLVGAPGYRVGSLQPRNAAKGTSDDPLVFVLEETNYVTVRCVDNDDRALTQLQLRFDSDAPMFAGARMLTGMDSQLHGIDMSTQSLGNGARDYTASLPLPDDGELVLASLEPGRSVRVRALDALGATAAEATFATPAMGDETDVTLRVTKAPRHLLGRFVDASGQPVGNVQVRAGNAGRRTGADGLLQLPRVYGTGPVRVLAIADGYVARMFDAQPTTDATEQQWILERGRSVTLRVLDGDDGPMDLRVRVDGVRSVPQRLGDGRLRFDNLPAREVEFVASMGGETFSLRHDATVADATLRVPTPARLSLAVAGTWPTKAAGERLVAEVRRVDENADKFTIRRADDDVAVHLLRAGRVRITLLIERGGTRVPTGLAAEVTLRAGEATRAALR